MNGLNTARAPNIKHDSSKGNTSDVVAQLSGKSHGTIDKIKDITASMYILYGYIEYVN